MLRRSLAAKRLQPSHALPIGYRWFVVGWCSVWLLAGPSASAAEILFNGFTRDDRQITGTLTGETPENLQFVSPGNISRSLDQIRFLDLPIAPRALPDRGWKRIRLRNGDVLHGKVASPPISADGQPSTFVKWFTGFTTNSDLPLSGVAALSHAVGTRCIVYEDFETETTGWKNPAGTAITANRERARSGSSSLKCSTATPSIQYDLDQPISKGSVEFSFFLNPEEGPQGDCAAVFKWVRGQQPIEIEVSLLGSEPWYEIRLPADGDWQRQNVPRRPGWHVIGISWQSDEMQVSLDGFPLAAGRINGQSATQLTAAAVTSSLKSGAIWIDDFALVESVPDSHVALMQSDSDQLDLVSGDQLFGKLRGLDARQVQFTAGSVDSQVSWNEIRELQLATRPLAPQPVAGYMVRIDLQPWTHSPALKEADFLRGALLSVNQESCIVDHPICGRLTIPWRDIRRLQPAYRGQEWVLEGRVRHVGNEVKSAFATPVPEGTRLKWSFDLATVPSGTAYVALTTSDLEPAAPETIPHQWLKQLRAGHLTSELWLNDRRVAVLNHVVSGRGTADQPRRLRIRIPDNSLIAGKNQLAIRLQPSTGDPIEYDDWQLRELRLEVEAQLSN